MSITPLARWEDERIEHPDLVWFSRLDDRYLCEVQRDSGSGYRAHLRLFDREQEFRLLLDEPVNLSYEARFGPDVDDVAMWQQRLVEFIDGREE